MPLGFVQVAPPSLVMTAEPPLCGMANQVLRVVAAAPVSTKNGNHDTPPVGQPAPDTNFHVSPPSVDSASRSASWKPVMRCVGSCGIDDDRVEARVVLFRQRARERKRQPAVNGLEHLLVAIDVRHPQRRGRRAADGKHVAERQVRRVGPARKQLPGLAVVGRLPDRTVAADVEIAGAHWIDDNVTHTEAVRAREQ